MLKFSANLSLLFSELALVERFKAAKDRGFDAVEIQFPYCFSAELLKNILDDQQLKLVQFNVAADDLLLGGEGLACVPEKRDQFRAAISQALEYSSLLKPEVINVLPGCCLTEKRKPEYLSVFKENLCFAAEAFAASNIKIVFEAINSHDMPGFIVDDGQQMLDIWQELALPNLFMQYDIYHMQMMGGDVPAFITKHAHKIGHIQFADCPGRAQPGTGALNFDRIFSVIEDSRYEGWVGAEYNSVGPTAESLSWFSAFHPI